MVEVLMSSDFDTSHIPPFAGYCAFTAASVYAILLHKTDSLVLPSFSSLFRRILSNMVLLSDLSGYWAILLQMVGLLSHSCLNSRL